MNGFSSKLLVTVILAVLLIAGGTTTLAKLDQFLLKDSGGQYYSYNKDAINSSYLAYQLDPTKAAGNMYRHFTGVINTGGAVVGLYDTVKGYMDYAAASAALLKAQLQGTAFNIDSYLASAGAKKLEAEVSGVKVVNSQGNIEGVGSLIYGDWLLISNESTDAATTQSTGTLSISGDSIETLDTADLDDEAFRVNPSLPADETADALSPPAAMQDSFAAAAQGDTRSFYVYNYRTATYGDTLSARLAYSGDQVEVWVEQNNPKVIITDEMAAIMGGEFESRIYALIRDNYYTESDVNGDGKVAILCYDIIDNYSGSGSAYTGGYFAGNDLTGTTSSNRMELLYADTWPTMGTDPANPDVTKVYSTLAHEFQHLVNANRNQLEEKRPMETWLNEALSLSAEHLYEGVQSSRIEYYNKSAAIRNGRSLLNWNNSNEVLANYALSYLFSQYLTAQMNEALGVGHQVKFFREIIVEDSGGYQAVEKVVKKHIDGSINFGKLMTNFRAALLRRDSKGIYGFGGQTGFDAIQTPLYTGGAKALEGGGAIVKGLSGPFTDPGNRGLNITYLGLFRP
ncbi:MAG: hypothetical protein BI182_05810 [Acetobacterium sp. MES1]|uniref:hypothetical protein n=1 Tax=Acetobacterium sp. MES1 TaxID=1899015 RepID=UPI000B9CA904|nr:hypothetical protein [Acetobacterium sp. MES1]OXS25245.1 MAG: hypothetical protein BI182_05810 [Acetobacterium sp. MES1]